jgi:hypothetical protein
MRRRPAVCKGQSSEELKFRIRVSADGDVYVTTTKEMTQSGETLAHAYVNALAWEDGDKYGICEEGGFHAKAHPRQRSPAWHLLNPAASPATKP